MLPPKCAPHANQMTDTGELREIDVVPTQLGYDQWSQVYDTDENPLILLEEKHLPALVGEVSGLRIIDIGCGTGRQSLKLAANGARVTAVDFSREMLNQASRKPGADKVTFLEHDI